MYYMVLRPHYGHEQRLYQTCSHTRLIVWVLLGTLPRSYRKEAQVIFYETCEPTDIKEALYYCAGGIQYRLRWTKNKLGRCALYISQKVYVVGKNLFLSLGEKTLEQRKGEHLATLFYSIQTLLSEEVNSLLQSLEIGLQRYLRLLFSSDNPISSGNGNSLKKVKRE